MTNKFCDSPIHKFSSLALAFIILAFCVLPSFVSADSYYSNEPIGYKDGDTFRDILLVVLDSWGISFSKSDSTDDTSILEYADQLMQEFYEYNQTTQEVFWDLVKYGVDQTGNILLDFLGVNKIRQFANWLIDKFSLSDNSSTPTSSNTDFISVCGILSDLLPATWYNENNQLRAISSNQSPIYYSFIDLAPYAPGWYAIYAYSNAPFSVIGYPSNSTANAEQRTNNIDGSYFYTCSCSVLYQIRPSVYESQFADYPLYTSSYINQVLSENIWSVSGPSSSSLVINTTIINVPDSTDYSSDDGLKIEVPGTNWGDSINTILDIIERLIGLYDSTQLNINTVFELLTTLLQTLQPSVSVENIPGAVTLNYDEYDIPLESDWSIVNGFFSSDSEASPLSTLTSIVYGFPAPLILFFSVIVIFIIAYGFIRMGRDSH